MDAPTDQHCTKVEDDKSVKTYDEEQEKLYFQRVINAFKYYRLHSMRRVIIAEKYFLELPVHHQALIGEYRDHLKAVRTCIEHNYEIIKLAIGHTDHIFENKPHDNCNNSEVAPKAPNPATIATEFDMDKVKSTLKQFMRDWSSEGATERDACYKPIVDEIAVLFPATVFQKLADIKVLVPGAGLGRLAYEIARLGYSCQGNELSLFMLFASNFVLNRCKEVNCYTLYPWVHQYCNNLSSDDQIRAIQFPDINPADIPEGANFSMAAGDFLEVYAEPDSWDCVATVFFMDTAHNIIAYVENIWHILKPGGYWINFGPLLYHFADMPKESSIELSYEEFKKVVIKMNFEIIKEELNRPTGYTQNPRSMLKYKYDCTFFVARKLPFQPDTPR